MIAELTALAGRVADLERRLAGTMRHGKVDEVNPEEAWVRLDFGKNDNGDKFLSPKIPYAQIAGELKLHSPPSEGQQMTMLAPGGDWQQAVAVPMTWSNDNPSPSDAGDVHKLTFGEWVITLETGTLTVECGGTKWTFSSDGLVQDGGHIEHDGLAIDAHHKHSDVVAGGDLTGPPVAE